jgi:hypothetical protein
MNALCLEDTTSGRRGASLSARILETFFCNAVDKTDGPKITNTLCLIFFREKHDVGGVEKVEGVSS